MSMGDLTKYAYVRYAEAAVEHLFAVTTGWTPRWSASSRCSARSRRAYAAAEANHTVGRTLHELAQRALSVGKRVHSETGIDAAGASVVSVALDMADTPAGRAGRPHRGRDRRRIDGRAVGRAPGAGRHRPGARRQPVAAARRAPRRKPARAGRRRPTRSRSTTSPSALADADVVVSCTGAVGRWCRSPTSTARWRAGRRAQAWWSATWACRATWTPRSRDCPASASSTWTASSASRRRGRPPPTPTRPAQIVATEVATYLAGQRMAEVTPDRHRVAPARGRRRRGRVAAAGQPAAGAGLHRSATRSPGPCAGSSTSCCTRPTVRVKQLASAPGGDTYAEALRELFELDPTPSTPSPLRRIAFGGKRNSIAARPARIHE